MDPSLAETPVLISGATQRDRSGGLPFWVIALGFVTLLGLGLTLAFVIHSRFVGFERIAARHVPADTTLALRWDVEKVSLFEPTRRFLLPLFDATPAAAPATPSAGTRRSRLASAAQLEIGRDLREAVLLFGPEPGDWAVVLAGSFPKGDLSGSILGTLQSEGARAAGSGRIQTPSGMLFARAPDGAFVIAANQVRLEAALRAQEPPASIPRLGAGALVLHPDRGGLPPGAKEVLEPLGPVTEVLAQAEWGSPLRVDVTFRFPEAPPADAAERIQVAFERLFGPDAARLQQRFGRLKLQPAGNRAVRVRLLLDDPALMIAADRAARAVVSELALRPALD